MGNILLDIGRINDAIQFLENSASEAKQVHNDWVWMTGKIAMAYAYYLKGEKRQALTYFHEFLEESRKVQATVYLYPYLMELCIAMKEGKLPQTTALSFEKEIADTLNGENIFLKGVAYRCRAILWQMEGRSPKKIMQSANDSVRWLEESGSQVELSKSKLFLARQHLAMGEEDKAKELIVVAR
jgi:tetratricopeptide (TPR) repeat protein